MENEEQRLQHQIDAEIKMQQDNGLSGKIEKLTLEEQFEKETGIKYAIEVKTDPNLIHWQKRFINWLKQKLSESEQREGKIIKAIKDKFDAYKKDYDSYEDADQYTFGELNGRVHGIEELLTHEAFQQLKDRENTGGKGE